MQNFFQDQYLADLHSSQAFGLVILLGLAWAFYLGTTHIKRTGGK